MAYEPVGLAQDIFKQRYAHTPEETWGDLSIRVAEHVATAEDKSKAKLWVDAFAEVLCEGWFVPGGRILNGSNRIKAQLLNCFSGDVLDSREGWGQMLYDTTVISGLGGGVGINFCMDPSTLVLTQNLKWVRLDSLKVGDTLIAPEEYHTDATRKLVSSKVEATENVNLPSYEILTDKGVMLVSETHPILARKIRDSYKKKGQGFSWVFARDLTPEYELAFACDPWGDTLTQDTIWLGGLLDGEGCISKPKDDHLDRSYSARLSVGQNKGVVFNKIGEVFDKLGVKYHVRKNSGNSCYQYQLCTKWDSLKVLALCPTHRLWPKRNLIWENTAVRCRGSNHVRVQKVTSVGVRPLIALQTSSSTFIGDGFFQHNSQVRPRGDSIRGTGGFATGAVSAMKMQNGIADELRQGGGRRAALMQCLNFNHPDTPEFLEVKLDRGQLTNANISVVLTMDNDEFTQAVLEGRDLPFVFNGLPRDRTFNAKELWDKLVHHAWLSGEPGVLNGWLANKMNNIYYYAPLVVTNPCGEIFMPPYDCCNLGALNLPMFVKDGSIDYERLDYVIRVAVRMLDDVLDINHFPLPKIQEVCTRNRRVGLGVMGLHTMMLKLGIVYGSTECISMLKELFEFIRSIAYGASSTIAAEKGPFPGFDRDRFLQSGYVRTMKRAIKNKIKLNGIRNCALLTVAPTGTTSMVMGVSSGIEPIYAPAYLRRYRVGEEYKQAVVVSQEYLDHGALAVGAYDIPVRAHFEVQATIQDYVDNSISKTINLPETYPEEELSDLWLEYLPRIKGSTIYREGSRGDAPLQYIPISEVDKYVAEEKARADELGSLECPSGICQI